MDSYICEGSIVKMHFRLSLETGKVIDETFGSSPAELIIGDNSLPKEFESDLLGCKAGDKKTVAKTPDQAFGKHNPKNVHNFPLDKFEQAEKLEIGTVIECTDAKGNAIPAVVTEITSANFTADFNHPLVDKIVLFEFEIISVSN